MDQIGINIHEDYAGVSDQVFAAISSSIPNLVDCSHNKKVVVKCANLDK